VGGSVHEPDAADDARLRPSEVDGQIGRQLTEHIVRRLHTGQYKVGCQLAQRLRERRRRRARVVGVKLAGFAPL
jgi:hypothetical protein